MVHGSPARQEPNFVGRPAAGEYHLVSLAEFEFAADLDWKHEPTAAVKASRFGVHNNDITALYRLWHFSIADPQGSMVWPLDRHSGLAAFARAYPASRGLLFGGQGVTLEEALSRPATDWL